MDLFAIWREQQEQESTPAPQGYVNPAAMASWAEDSIEAREAVKAGAFE